jgi:hypothetical protein
MVFECLSWYVRELTIVKADEMRERQQRRRKIAWRGATAIQWLALDLINTMDLTFSDTSFLQAIFSHGSSSQTSSRCVCPYIHNSRASNALVPSRTFRPCTAPLQATDPACIMTSETIRTGWQSLPFGVDLIQRGRYYITPGSCC